MGGGGGGALIGAEFASKEPGIGGGGGGALDVRGGGGGAFPVGIGGAGGGGALGVDGLPNPGDLAFWSSSIALKGRGGAMVPNSMLANCLADPPVGRSSSSSSLSELLFDEVESKADQSSESSGRWREGRGPLSTAAAID